MSKDKTSTDEAVDDTPLDDADERVAIELFKIDLERVGETAGSLPGIFRWSLNTAIKKTGREWSSITPTRRVGFRKEAQRIAAAYRGEETVGH